MLSASQDTTRFLSRRPLLLLFLFLLRGLFRLQTSGLFRLKTRGLSGLERGSLGFSLDARLLFVRDRCDLGSFGENFWLEGEAGTL